MREFTSARPAEYVNPLASIEPFMLDGVEFRCLGELSQLDLSDLARRVAGAGDDPEKASADVQASLVGAMSETLMMAMGQAEYDRFRVHCRVHHTPDDILIEIMQMINEQIQSATEAAAGRPTVPSSPSSDGVEDREDQMSRVVSAGFGDVTVIQPQDHKPPRQRGGKVNGRPPVRRGQRATG